MADNTTAKPIAISWLSKYAAAITAGDVAATVSLFLSTGWFRDGLTFAWNPRAFEGTDKIASYLTDKLKPGFISDIELLDDRLYRPICFPAGPVNGVEVSFSFETPIGHGRGFARVLPDGNGEWKALHAGMVLLDLKGYEEAGCEFGTYGGHTLAWTDVYAQRRAKVESDPHVLIVGAGQTGLILAARFKQMNIPTIIIERNARVGDNWRMRYPTLTLHSIKAHHEFLYQPYPSNWPLFSPRDKLADWMESYPVAQDLIVWKKSNIEGHPLYHDDTKKWDVTINRDGSPVTIRPAHIVMATGALGEPIIPFLSNRDAFTGDTMHSLHYQGGKSFEGKRAVVVGAATSALDICQDLSHHGAASVTVVQRSSTCVVGEEVAIRDINLTWPEGKTEVGDFKFGAMGFGMLKRLRQGITDQMWEEDKVVFDKLRKGGFKLNMGAEGPCNHGYHYDKGISDLVASGQVKVKQGVEPTAFTENGILFSDGSQLEADVVIFATGYKKIRETARKLFGDVVIDRVGEVYGLDQEGEINGAYRPSGHSGLWFGTGDFWGARFLGKQLALQIKAREVGLVKE